MEWSLAPGRKVHLATNHPRRQWNSPQGLVERSYMRQMRKRLDERSLGTMLPRESTELGQAQP